MSNRFMMSVAAVALIAGTGFANAQGTGMSREAPSGGSTVQQSAPSSDRAAPSSATPMNRSDDSKGTAAKTTQSDEKPAAKTTQSDQKMQPGGAKNQRAQDDIKAGPKGEKSAQENNLNNNMKGEKSNSMSSETTAPAGKDMKAEGRNGNTSAEQKGAVDTKSQTTTGQAGASAKLSSEQRTRITTVIRGEHVQPLNNVNFSISVGTRVPHDVRFNPLPAEVVTVYPEWRGYEFILVNDQIIVVDPRTFEIVAVLDV
jgi:hypothetical protein